MSTNPFLKSMTKLRIPAHMGNNISVAGFYLEGDENGDVEVPAEHVPELLAHGLTPAPVQQAEAAKKAAK